MSEPNDTAQEGFDQLKRNLEVRYPEDSDLSLDEFLNVESLLALAVRVCGPGADPRKADRLLSNYQLIRPETIGADGHLMQMARRHLFSLASSTAWRRLLGLYERAEYERYRFFDIANGGMALREHPLTGIDRMPIPRPADTAARHAAASGPRRAARTHARTGTCAHRRPWPASP